MSEALGNTKSDSTRLRILHAAAKAFRQNGYAASSLRDIADSADMQAGSLYYHFDSKEVLAEAVMDEGVLGALQEPAQPWPVQRIDGGSM